MRSTKKSLVLSALSLMLCVAMLLGTTYAWFTDSVTSGKNIITAGNLDIEMYYADGTKAVPAADSFDWKDASNVAIFDYDLWEPGYTEVYHIKIANVGTLALKYQLSIATDGDVGALADVLDVYAIPTATQVADRSALTDTYKIGTMSDVLSSGTLDLTGNLMPKGSKDASGNDATFENTLTLAVKMQETAGNEYQGLSVGDGFNVVVKATQYTYEEDSFNNQYDKDAEYPVCEHENMSKESYVLKDGKLYYYCPDCFEKVALTDTEFAALAGKVLVKNGDTLSVSDKTPSQIVSAATKEVDIYLTSGEYTFAGSAPAGVVKANVYGLNDKDGKKVATIIGHNGAEPKPGYYTIANVDLVLNNVIVKGSTDSNQGWYHGIQSKKLTCNNCDLIGGHTLYAYDKAEFNNCHFDSTGITTKADYSVYCYNDKADFNNCSFVSAGKAIKIYSEGNKNGVYNINNCTFTIGETLGAAKSDKAAIQIDSTYQSTNYIVNVTGCTQVAYDGGLVADSSTHSTITVNGVTQ